MKLWSGPLAGLAVAAAAASAAAQTPPAPVPDAPPVEQLVERALARAPSLAAQRARLESVTLSVRAADALPDPMVELEYRAGGFPRYTIGSDPGSMLGASIRQDLLSKGRRTARRETAVAGITLGRAELDARMATIAAAVRERYARLYLVDREADTLADARQLLRLLEATATARYAAGDADQASVLRVQLEQSRLGERMSDLASERLIVVAEMNRLLDDETGAPIGRVRALPAADESVAGTQGAAISAALASAPELIVKRAEVEVAGNRVNEARQELGRAWSVGGGLFWQGGLDRMAVFNVGIELPFWKDRKQKPLIAAAERDLDALRADEADAAAAVRGEVTRLLTIARTGAEQIERYRSAIMPQSTAALDATRSSYLAGRGDFVAVLDEFRRWIDVRIGLAQRETDRYVALVQLAALTGPTGT
ncbi:MAG: TolC family protein [Vicinamibacterales bacterium]|nr:TolC family protein [Vicinamibacterales bacterium]